MFVRIKFVTTNTTDVLGNPLTQKTQTYYLLDGQVPDDKTTHPMVQKQYKEIYEIQERESISRGYPVTVFEVLKLYQTNNSSTDEISTEQN